MTVVSIFTIVDLDTKYLFRECWPRAEPTTGNEKPVLLGAAQRLAGRERYSYSSLKSEKIFQTFFSAHDQWLGLGETQEQKPEKRPRGHGEGFLEEGRVVEERI